MGLAEEAHVVDTRREIGITTMALAKVFPANKAVFKPKVIDRVDPPMLSSLDFVAMNAVVARPVR